MSKSEDSKKWTGFMDSRLVHDHELTAVPVDERRSVFSIITVWFGFLFTPSILFVGSSIALQSSSFSVFVVALIVAMFLAAMYATIMGIVGERYGLSTYMVFRRFFGRWGSKLPSAIITLTRIGWTAVEASIAASVVLLIFDFPGGQTSLAAVLAILFLLTAILGYTGLDYLSKIAVPLLAVVFIAAVVKIVIETGARQAIAYTPDSTSSFSTLVSQALALWAAGATLTPDITRYAKSDRDVVVANFSTILPGEVFLLALGAIVAFNTGMADPALGITQIGLLGFGAIAIFLAAWTTCDSQYYSAGLALSEITSRRKAPLLIIVGIVTAAIAYLGIYASIISYLNLIGIFVPPIVGVVAADYYALRLRYPKIEDNIENVQTKINPAAVIAWLTGVIVGYFAPGAFVPALASFVGALVIYVFCYYVNIIIPFPIFQPPLPDEELTTRE